MPIYKRGDSANWYIRIGRDIDRSAKTASKTDAQALEAKWRQELRRQTMFGESPRRTWDDAVLRWSQDVGQHRRGWETDSYRLEWLTTKLSGQWLEDISRQTLDDIMLDRPAITPATHNHFVDLVRAVLRYAARELQWVDRVPVFRRRTVDNQRVRFLKDWAEAERLIQAMPEHWRDPARFSLLTGIRQSTMRDLRWEWVDLKRGTMTIPASSMKSDRRVTLPITKAAAEVLKRQPRDREHVFVRPDGQPMGKLHHKVWTAVLRRSGMTGFRWHDLRHTWASWSVMGGMDLYTLQRLGAWESPAMVQRYAHLGDDHLRQAAEATSAQFRHIVRDQASIQRGRARKRQKASS